MRRSERRQALVQYLSQESVASVAVMAAKFSVSEMTIRRDLDWLEDKGHVRRVYGGAMATELASFALTSQSKLERLRPEKERIGEAAAQLVESGDSIILDAGTTVLQMARHLQDKRITVVTNSLQILLQLIPATSVEVYMIGGLVSRSGLATIGPHVGEFLAGISADKAFLGVDGIGVPNGLTSPDAIEAYTKRRLAQSARSVYVLADHSKLGKSTLHTLGPLSMVKAIITDSGAAEDVVTQLREHVEVVVV